MAQRNKIALVGAGNIGGMLAAFAALDHLGDVTLIDIADGIPQGKALDLSQTTPIRLLSSTLNGTTDMSGLANADAVVVTAGIPRKPGMSRDDLISTNIQVMRSVANGLRQYCPEAFVVCITNPLDVMVGVLQQLSGLPPQKVVGMAGILDSARMRSFIAEQLDVAVQDVSALVLGGHGDTMVPLPRLSTVAGIPLPTLTQMGWITQNQIDSIIERTRHGGAEVVGLLKTSAYFAPAAAAIEMITAYLRNEKRVLPCAAWVEGAYGLDGLYVGVPAVIGGNGIERIIELPLQDTEREALNASIQHVRDLNAVAQNLLSQRS